MKNITMALLMIFAQNFVHAEESDSQKFYFKPEPSVSAKFNPNQSRTVVVVTPEGAREISLRLQADNRNQASQDQVAASIGTTGWQPEQKELSLEQKEFLNNLDLAVRSGCSHESQENALQIISHSGLMDVDLSQASVAVQKCLLD